MAPPTSKATTLTIFLFAIIVSCDFDKIFHMVINKENKLLNDTRPLVPSMHYDTSESEDSMISSSNVMNHTLDYDSCINNNSTVPEDWCLDMDNIPRYVGKENWPPRMIQHYTPKGYDKCLAGKSVVFIGDSRVRYQYMHLASYLKTRRFMRCQDFDALDDVVNSPDTECYLIDHEHHLKMVGDDWISWYKHSTEMLGESSLSSSNSTSSSAEGYKRQSSICDCYRPSPFQPKETYENRYTKRSTPFGDINLMYFQTFSDLVRVNKDFPPYRSFTTMQRCQAGECGHINRTNAFEGSVNDTLWEILPRINATHAFVQLGWEHLIGFDKISEFSCTIRDFERHHSDIKLYLISHPPHKSHVADPSAMFNPKRLKCDSDILDRSSVNKNVPFTWYWDKMHVLSILNEEYNHQLVEKICPISK